MKNYCSDQDSFKRIKAKVTDWEKIFANHIYDAKESIQNIKRTLTLNNKKINTPI